VPEITSYAPGTPTWIDLASSDLEQSIEFYEGLFGWQHNTLPDGGGYTMFELGGKQVCAVGPIMNPGQPPSWTTYIGVTDADATAKAVEAAGGTVLAPPFEVMTAGKMGVFMDPTGAAFSVWQPGEHKGAELANEANTWGWNDLHTRDVEKAKAFYAEVFGWECDTQEMGPMTYTEVKVEGRTVGGIQDMNPMIPPMVPAFWLVWFQVDDTDAAVAKAQGLGASVMSPPMDIPPGRFAILTDPAGANFAVIKSALQG
jgi:predicted enzyme related to lactoylglutathione lyase